tara:strand:- start:5706 stop:6947 length:1242 start_codon:yes stop_codon:yes gene_type:complete
MKYILINFLLLFQINYSNIYSQNKLSNSHALNFDSTSDYFDSLNLNIYKTSPNYKKTNFINFPKLSDSLIIENLFELNSKTPINLTFNESVRHFIEIYTVKSRNQTSKMLGMSKYYFPIFEEILAKHNLPLELKFLPIIESSLKPKARSPVGATGLWQFMYSTALENNLKISSYVDERMDPYLSTEAACNFFKTSYEIYGDWLLVLASFNSGRGNVNKAIRRSGGKKSFWEIQSFLPKETRNYIPAFIAVCYSMNYNKIHEIYPNEYLFSFNETDTIEVKYRVNLNYLKDILQIPLSDLANLNPSYKYNIIPKINGEKYFLRLPIDKLGTFISNENFIYEHFKKIDIEQKTNYPKYFDKVDRYVFTVSKGDYLGKISLKFNCKIEEIKKWNNLKTDKIFVGQKLVLYVRPDLI